jgi:hypothetical protein
LIGGTTLVRKLFFLFTSLFILLSAACTDGGPYITSASQSAYLLVTGQKVLLMVSSLTDNPPMTFIWNDDNTESTFQDSYGNIVAKGTVTNMYGIYWTTPETPGIYNVSCIVGDKFNTTDRADFIIYVSARSISMLMDANPAKAIVISTDLNSIYSGLFAVVSGDKDIYNVPTDNIKLFTSSIFKYDTGWGASYSLTAFYPIYYSSLYQSYYTYWGGYLSDNTINLIRHTTSVDDSIYSKQTSVANESVNSITMINGNIWVSANSGLWKLDSLSPVFSDPVLSIQSYNVDGTSALSAVATTLGVYYSTTSAMNWQPLPGGQGKPISVVTISSPLNIFALLYNGTTKKLMQYFKDDNGNWTNMEIKPDPGATLGSITRISKDFKGRIWCGNKRWDGTSWFYPDRDNILPDAIDYTIISGEGMAYFRTTSGQLWGWGRTPTPYYPR